MIDLTGGNYRAMFPFAALFMLFAGLLMVGVKELNGSIPGATSGEGVCL
jgi:hypothetical protein